MMPASENVIRIISSYDKMKLYRVKGNSNSNTLCIMQLPTVTRSTVYITANWKTVLPQSVMSLSSSSMAQHAIHDDDGRMILMMLIIIHISPS